MILKRLLRIFSAACVLGLLTAAIPLPLPVAAVAPPSINVLPTSGAPGTLLTVNGYNFTASSTSATIYFGTTPVLFSVPIIGGAAGTFLVQFAVPAAALTGPTTVSAISNAAESVSTPFTVLGGINVSPVTGFVGDSFQVSGNGFGAGQAVSLYWDSAASTPLPGSPLTSTLSGTISGTFNVPATFRGPHTILTSMLAIPAQTYTVKSQISITPTSGSGGDTVTITGDGFAASAPISLQVDGNPVNTNPGVLSSNANGHFGATITMPSLARGTHVITALDANGSATANFSVGQKIAISPTSGILGDAITVTGNGFSNSEAITVKVDGVAQSTTPVTVTSSTTGNFNATFAIPGVAAGTHIVSATDADGNVATANLTVIAKITMTPTSGNVGTQISLSGSGFTPGATVNVYWDNVILSGVTTTGSTSGSFSALTFNAPASVKGVHTVKVSDTAGNQDSATFTIAPKVSITPASGAYGGTITINGTGFASVSAVTFTITSGSNTYSLSANPAPVTTGTSGSFSATFSVPAVYSGNWTIQATDAALNSAQATLAVTSLLILSPTTGGAGDQVTATGTGFAANRPISLKYGAVTLNIGSVSTDNNGSFVIVFTVPGSAAGAFTITASDGSNSATSSFVAAAAATISEQTTSTNDGYVGESLTITGTGFLASHAITISYASTPVTLTTVTSDASGGFTATFTIPASPAGQHTITASDGTTSKTFNFFMDSTAPAAPTQVSPVDKFKPKQPVPFSWVAVSDPSGVTYTLQISQDANFGTPIVDHSGLTTTGYTMTAAEKLKSAGSKSPYYWRVRATDRAGNVGAWSTANTFTIGFLWPGWMIHVWYSLGIIVALILGLWLGRRMAYQSY